MIYEHSVHGQRAYLENLRESNKLEQREAYNALQQARINLDYDT